MPIAWSNPMQVTISLLPVALSIVHIPRSRLPQLSHPILRQILQPNPTFLNITCNEIELSLFAEDSVISHFEPIARRDRLRQRSGSDRAKNEQECVEISCEKWRVLQVDSHNDQLDNSGARVSEVSAPLAAAGISILYQSSYMSDFIFVKESRLQESMALFAAAGFDLYSSDNEPHTGSPSYSPLAADKSPSDALAPPTVLTRSRSGTTISKASQLPLTEASRSNTPNCPGFSGPSDVNRTKSHSPSSGEVDILSPDLTSVGLSDELGVDHWGLKIVKLVAFPDLIPLPSSKTKKTPLHAEQGSPPPSESSTHLLSCLPTSGSPSSSEEEADEDDGYFSNSPEIQSSSSIMTPASRSCTDLSTNSSPFKPSSKHVMLNLPLLSISNKLLSRPAMGHSKTYPGVLTTQSGGKLRVPFFSFTRTTEGSSLTTDVSILAALFPPHERHMVICSGELDAEDDRNAKGIDSDDEDEDDLLLCQGSSQKCLQIDLRRYGLDKHGLVNRFSRLLEANGINHMYSSTVKTANLLVDKRNARRAQSLLRAC